MGKVAHPSMHKKGICIGQRFKYGRESLSEAMNLQQVDTNSTYYHHELAEVNNFVTKNCTSATSKSSSFTLTTDSNQKTTINRDNKHSYRKLKTCANLHTLKASWLFPSTDHNLVAALVSTSAMSGFILTTESRRATTTVHGCVPTGVGLYIPIKFVRPIRAKNLSSKKVIPTLLQKAENMRQFTHLEGVLIVPEHRPEPRRRLHLHVGDERVVVLHADDRLEEGDDRSDDVLVALGVEGGVCTSKERRSQCQTLLRHRTAFV